MQNSFHIIFEFRWKAEFVVFDKQKYSFKLEMKNWIAECIPSVCSITKHTL